MHRSLQQRRPTSETQPAQRSEEHPSHFPVPEPPALAVTPTSEAEQRPIEQPEVQRSQPTYTLLPPGAPPADGPVFIQPSLPDFQSSGSLPMQETDDLAAKIRAQLGRGAPLGMEVQRELETGLGESLSGVQVHTDATADALARSVDAVAFTTGRDIFFRQGTYRPETPRGMQLLAHEATHTIQQSRGPVDGTPHPGGVSISNPNDRFERAAHEMADNIMNRAPSIQPTPTSARPENSVHIQRAIGFEFETSWSTYRSHPPLTDEQKRGHDPLHVRQLEDMRKKDLILKGSGFSIEADERAHAGEGSDMEFVTRPFGENERSSLEKAMTQIEEICEKLMKSKYTYLDAKSDLWWDGKAGPHRPVIKKGSGLIDANPQATGGIRLDQIFSMMQNIGAAQGPESVAVHEARGFGRTALMSMSPKDRNILGQVPGMVINGIATYTGRAAGTADQAPLVFGSEKLKGLLSLVVSYLIKGNTLLGDYAKTIAPLMARTDFSAIFDQLPQAEYDYLAADDVNGRARFVALALEAAGMPGTENTPVFRGGIDIERPNPAGGPNIHVTSHDLDAITRLGWLEGMTQGIDRLTDAWAPVSQQVKDEMGILSLGGLGRRTEQVKVRGGKVAAPIFEFRRMAKGLSYYTWKGLALDVFDYVVALNKGPAFTGQLITLGNANWEAAEARDQARRQKARSA